MVRNAQQGTITAKFFATFLSFVALVESDPDSTIAANLQIA
jgi:hypothetical protein